MKCNSNNPQLLSKQIQINHREQYIKNIISVFNLDFMGILCYIISSKYTQFVIKELFI